MAVLRDIHFGKKIKTNFCQVSQFVCLDLYIQKFASIWFITVSGVIMASHGMLNSSLCI